MGILGSQGVNWFDDLDIDIPGDLQFRESGEENRKGKVLACGSELS